MGRSLRASCLVLGFLLVDLGACGNADSGATDDASGTDDTGGASDVSADGTAPGDASSDASGDRPVDAPSEVSSDGHAEAGDAGTGGFVHPGVLVTKSQLDFVKAKIAAKEAPWTAAVATAKSSKYGNATYKATPRAIVECGSFSVPDNGCSDEMSDSTAAYVQALLYVLTGEEAYALKSIEIMNAWSAVITDHTNSNAPLQSAWVASVFPRAGELIRTVYGKWPAAEVARFSKMLTDVYLPKVAKGSTANGNWELSMAEASMAIGVFNDDRPTFEGGVSLWRKRVPAYLYLASDGAQPVTPPGTKKTGADLATYWYNPGKYVEGLCQETCRDLGHVQLGFAAMIDGAETAHIQGVDLYGEEEKRLATGLEWNAQWLDGVAPPSTLCGGTLTGVSTSATWEIALNALSGRLHHPMTHVASIASKVRPTHNGLVMIYETLTHYGVGG